jgi:DNA-binding protein HU-beta
MNKTKLISAAAKESNIKKSDAEMIIDAFLEVIQNEVANGEKIQITGFGTFERKERGERDGKNPRTGEIIKIKAAKYPAFSAGSIFKEKVNK